MTNTVKSAMLKTAALLDANPEKYIFMHGMARDIEDFGRACALVWIGHFLPYQSGHFTSTDIASIIVPDVENADAAEDEFLHRMEELASRPQDSFPSMPARDVAYCLREYVKEYLA